MSSRQITTKRFQSNSKIYLNIFKVKTFKALFNFYFLLELFKKRAFIFKKKTSQHNLNGTEKLKFGCGPPQYEIIKLEY